MGKMAQAMMYGAITMQIRGNFDDGMRLVKEIADKAPVTIVNSINPYRLQGQKPLLTRSWMNWAVHQTTTACQ